MYRRPELYDAIYSFKDYEAEATAIHDLVQKYKGTSGNRLLDVACGTGKHLEFLRAHYDCEGLDLSHFLLKAATERNPGIPFHEGDMRNFDLGVWFDAIICMFSAIGYVRTFEGLERAAFHLAKHAAPGGVLIIEPWFSPEDFQVGRIGLTTVDQPDYKVARMNTSRREGNVSILEFHFLVGNKGSIESFTDTSELGLFTPAEYKAAFERVGLTVTHLPEGITGRGLYVCQKPLT